MHKLQETEIRLIPVQIDKDHWIDKERIRWTKHFSVPIAEKMPDGFPVQTLGVQRALCAISQKAPAKLPSVIEALFRSLWIDRNSNIGKPEGFIPVLEGVIGKEATQEILQAVSLCLPPIYCNQTANILPRQLNQRPRLS
jgi:2-hydroxychromene-2-carboxylate isomerase